MATFWRRPCSLFCLLSWSRLRSVHSCVQFLSAFEASPGLPGAVWQLLAGCQCPGTQLQETQYRFCIFCIICLIINITSVISITSYIQLVSLSPFSSFSLPLVGGWGLIESFCHPIYWCPALNRDRTSGPNTFCCLGKLRTNMLHRK